MNISNTPLSTLSIESKLDFATKCVSLIKTRHTKDPLFGNTLANLEDSIQQTTLAIASNHKQKLTKEVNEADYKRGRCFILFRRHIEAEQFNEEDSEKRQASDLLINIIRAHGTQLHLEGMSAESSLLASLFKDMEGKDAIKALSTLNLTREMGQLKQAQSEFIALQEKRNELELNKEIPTKLEAQNELVKKLTVLLRGIDFLAVSQSKTYDETGQLVQQFADRIVTNERIGQRDPKKAEVELETEVELQAE
jgi:hypothetical protein